MLAAGLVAVAAFGDPARALLRWERAGLARGELWRLLTGHAVHLDLRHALVNALGLLLVAALWRSALRPAEWVLVLLAGAVAIDAGLWFLDPALDWYVGASGVLHAAMAAGIAREAAAGDRLAIALAVVGLLKLAGEQWGIGLPGILEESMAVTSAHRYGAAAGALLGMILYWVNNKK